MLNLKEARIQVKRAATLALQLDGSMKAWDDTGGLARLINRREDVCLPTMHGGMAFEPDEPFELLSGEIVGCLRKALDYIAWQVYINGGGQASSEEAKGIYFPICQSDELWQKAILGKKMPTAWPAAIEAFRQSQPFAQPIGQDAPLNVIQGLNVDDKHRGLSLMVALPQQMSISSPKAPPGYSTLMLMNRDRIHLRVGIGDEIMRYVITKTGEPPDRPVPRTPQFDITIPDPPRFIMLFARGKYELLVQAIPDLIDHVNGIVDRFDAL